ncbi:MAG: aminoacyl-tRNA hydrolase [Clostridia bacterium]|nr:aminoacyl-tRNA hydrolase [Clostridia bacterium]
MYLIVGLGNPEPEYSGTRHNMGFDVINKISQKYDIQVTKSGFKSLYGTGIIENEKVILCKPQTFMNLSGDAVIEITNFYKIPLDNIIIIHDDIDIEPGIVKIRKKGGPGTHNGMKSVVHSLGSQDFPRIRVGIGMPAHKNDLINYVIGQVSEEEHLELTQGINIAQEAVIEILKNGIDNAMNKIN